MKKTSLILIFLIAVFLFAACTGTVNIADGTYRAEYSDYDQQGYKEFIEITFEDGLVTHLVADAINGVDGTYKSESVEIKNAMEPVAGTYPAKYYKDLINQYLESSSAEKIDIVAGATVTSSSFIELMKALEKAVRTGNTDTVIVTRR